MNSVSLFVYFAGVVSQLNTLLALVVGGYFVIPAVILFVSFIALDGDLDVLFKSPYAKFLKFWWVVAIIAVFSVFVPSEKTLYLVAASELGETVVSTPEAKQVAEDLTTILHNYAKESLTTSK